LNSCQEVMIFAQLNNPQRDTNAPGFNDVPSSPTNIRVNVAARQLENTYPLRSLESLSLSTEQD